MPHGVIKYLENGIKGLVPETLKANDPILSNVNTTIIGTNITALHAAKEMAMALGYITNIHNADLSGDAETAAINFIKICKKYSGIKPAFY